MIGPIFQLEASVFNDLLLRYLPITIIGVLLGGIAGWQILRFVGDNLQLPENGPHSWLRAVPLTPLLILGAIVLPYFNLHFVVTTLLLAVLIIPTAFTWAARYYNVARHKDSVQAEIDRQVVLRTGWRDTGLVGLSLLLSGFIYAALAPGSRDSVTTLLPNLLPGLALGIAAGAVLGLLLGFFRTSLVNYLEQRHHRGEFSIVIEGVLGSVRSTIEALLTQFHGTPLATVLAIAAAGLPYTTASQNSTLPLLIFPPIASAVLAAMMVDDPAPNQPGVWQHLRTGLSNVGQICIGYLIGTAMLSPLAIVHTWMLDQPEQLSDALLTHLDLTFSALGYSLFLGMLGGILTSRFELLRTILINLGNIGRTIPSLAVLALALPIVGVGRSPSLVALVFIGTLPILVNTSVGIIEVSLNAKEAARGMGMNDLQVLWRVEIPMSMPVIMAGIRTSAVLIVASATLAAFIGGGGLGDLIYRGDSSGRDDILLTGAILATVLAIFLEYFFGWLEKLLTPRGLREA